MGTGTNQLWEGLELLYLCRSCDHTGPFLCLVLCHWEDDSPQLFPVQCCSSPGTYEPRFSLGGTYLVLVTLCDRLHHISPLRSSSTLPAEATDLDIKVWNAQDAHWRSQLSLLFQRPLFILPLPGIAPISHTCKVSELRFRLS